MYYVMSSKGQILETFKNPLTQDKLRDEANYFGCSVYVIEGEHYGMTADPGPDETEDEEDETP